MDTARERTAGWKHKLRGWPALTGEGRLVGVRECAGERRLKDARMQHARCPPNYLVTAKSEGSAPNLSIYLSISGLPTPVVGTVMDP